MNSNQLFDAFQLEIRYERTADGSRSKVAISAEIGQAAASLANTDRAYASGPANNPFPMFCVPPAG